MRDCATDARRLAGECFAPSLAGLKPLEQPELQVKMIGPSASTVRLQTCGSFFGPGIGDLKPARVLLPKYGFCSGAYVWFADIG